MNIYILDMNCWGEYAVPLGNSFYYTDQLDDALNTARFEALDNPDWSSVSHVFLIEWEGDQDEPAMMERINSFRRELA